jgi:transcriptional regulator with XRE-family HTH domain
MTAPLVPDQSIQDETGELGQGAVPLGAIAGTALHAARMSAQLSELQLAARAHVGADTIRGWEDGARPLAYEVAAQLERLENALRAADADPSLVADLAVAAWCDLVVVAIEDGEDTSCLLADPLAAEGAFSELLAWAIADERPERYRRYAPLRRLLLNPDRRLTEGVLAVIHALEGSAHDH